MVDKVSAYSFPVPQYNLTCHPEQFQVSVDNYTDPKVLESSNNSQPDVSDVQQFFPPLRKFQFS